MDYTISSEQRLQALNNVGKTKPEEFKQGDFVYLYCSGMKNDGGLKNSIYECSELCEQRYSYMRDAVKHTLCKIQGIVRTNDSDMLAERFENPNEGGSASDAFSSDEEYQQKKWKLSEEEINTFYQLVTMVVAEDTGRFIFVDRQGYDYNRYLYLCAGYESMFREEIEAREAEIQKIEEENERAWDERCEKERLETAEKLESKYGYIKAGEPLRKVILDILKHEGVKMNEVKVSVRSRAYTAIEIKCRFMETVEHVHKITHEIKNDFWYYIPGYITNSWGEKDRGRRDMFRERFGDYDYLDAYQDSDKSLWK